MKKIFTFFCKNNLLSNIVTLLILVVGINSLLTINKDLLPRIQLNELYIATKYLGASAEDVELHVTNKLENSLKSVVGIKKFTSQSAEDFSLITIRIDDTFSKDKVEKTVKEIKDLINNVSDLPPSVKTPTITRAKTDMIPIIGIGIHSDELEYGDLKSYAKTFEKKIRKIPGVAALDIDGYRMEKIFIEVEPDKLKDYQIPVNQVIGAVARRNIRGKSGMLQSYKSKEEIVTVEQFQDYSEIGDVIVRTSFNGPSIRVKNLAKVSRGFEKETIITKVNGKKVIFFNVRKKESADIIKTVKQIKNLIADEQNKMENIGFSVNGDLSKSVESSYNVILKNGISGFILVLIILAFFLNLRVSFWVAMGIPISLLGTITLLPLFNVCLDTITLTSMILLLGIIVDDAIVIAESVYQCWENGDPPIKAAVHGVQKVFWPVVTTVVSTLLAFLPLLMIKGDMGKFLFVIPLTISIALIISLLESVFILPAHLGHGLMKVKAGMGVNKGKHFFKKIQAGYSFILKCALKIRYLIVLIFLIIFGITIWYGVTKMPKELFPDEGATTFSITLETDKALSLDQTAGIISKVEEKLNQLPPTELDSYFTIIGRIWGQENNTQNNVSTIQVEMVPVSKRTRKAEDIVNALRNETGQIEGIKKIVYNLYGAGPTKVKPIEILIKGNNTGLRNTLASKVVEHLGAIEGVVDISRSDKEVSRQIKVSINHEKLAKLGLSVADVTKTLRIYYEGEIVTKVIHNGEEVEVKVQYPESARQNKEQLLQVSIPNSEGRFIPLHRFAKLVNHPGQNEITHIDGERSLVVMAGLSDKTITPEYVMEELKTQIQMGDFPGIEMDFKGEVERNKQSYNDIIYAFILSIIAIYCLLILLFKSVKQPLLVLSAIPFGLVGIVIIFTIHGKPLSFMAFMGLIGLSGVVVNDSLLMVNYLNSIVRNSRAIPSIDAISLGAADRLRAIILTTVTTAIGLIPMAYGIGGADPTNAPMTLALGWGLVFATPLTLILVPCLYMIDYDITMLCKSIISAVTGKKKRDEEKPQEIVKGKQLKMVK